MQLSCQYLRSFWLLNTLICFSLIAFSQAENSHILWAKGTSGYNNYRIPSVIISPQGTVLAFCEGREAGDSGDIDLLLRRSEDNGKSWGREIVVWNDSLNTCGNPCPVVDQTTGRIWLWMTWNYGADNEREIILKESKYTRKPYLCYSDDDGKTWSKPQDMSASCKESSWGWYATGPGIAIQLKSEKYKGRLVIPANHSYDNPAGKLRNGSYSHGAHVLISDDHGKNWRMSEPIGPDCNESQVAELSDGKLVMNMRSYGEAHCRAVSYSNDGGESWSNVQQDEQLVESRCQASILNYGRYKGQSLFLFSNPAVPRGRTHMTIRFSNNDCQSWQSSCLINANPSAYSCLVRLTNGRVGLLYETGKKRAYETITFEVFRLKELEASGLM